MPDTYLSSAETGFYYLNARYYDSEVGRFISADEYVSTGQGVLGNNMFSYCGNNPINMSDPTGNWPKWVTGVLNVVVGGAQMALGATLGATVGWTGIGGVVAGFLIANGAGVATKGVAQIINHVADKKVIR